MSIQAVAWVLDSSQSRGLARLVLIALANHANEEQVCWPSQRTIAREAGISLGAVSDQVRKLVDIGELEVVNKGNARKSARYRLVQVTNAQRSGDERSVHPRSEQNHQEPKEHSPTESTSTFEAFYEFWTGKRYVQALELPKSMRGRLNAAVKEARLAGITSEQVVTAGKRYRDTWSRMERTPQALLANWARFALDDSPIEECGECGNRGVIWFDGTGERCDYDDTLAESAAHCPSCHPEAV